MFEISSFSICENFMQNHRCAWNLFIVISKISLKELKGYDLFYNEKPCKKHAQNFITKYLFLKVQKYLFFSPDMFTKAYLS